MSQGPILVVEDDSSLSQLVCSLLLANGLEVETASNGRLALEQASLRRPALILLDLMMPVMTGYEFLRHLWARPDLEDVPVVVISGAHVPNPGGTVGFLRKPINVTELLRLVAPYRAARAAVPLAAGT